MHKYNVGTDESIAPNGEYEEEEDEEEEGERKKKKTNASPLPNEDTKFGFSKSTTEGGISSLLMSLGERLMKEKGPQVVLDYVKTGLEMLGEAGEPPKGMEGIMGMMGGMPPMGPMPPGMPGPPGASPPPGMPPPM